MKSRLISFALILLTGMFLSNCKKDNPEEKVKVPSAPSNLAAAAVSSTQINLSWTDNSTDETGFLIERSLNNTVWSEITSVAANIKSYQNTGLTASTLYYYRIRSYNSAGNSAYTAAVSATTSGASGNLPGAPSNLSATSTSTTQINLTWTDNSTNETGFKIERSPDGNTGWAEIGTVTANTTTFQNTGLTANTPYYYRVRAYNTSGNSAYSNTSNATTSTIMPAAPTNLSATAASSTQINLTWTDNSNNETGFKVERSPDGSTGWTEIASLAAGTTSYNNTGLTSGIKYYYRVYAYNGGGNSGYSNTANATTTSVPPIAPSGLTAVALSPTSVKLTWTDNSSDETGFEIERWHPTLFNWYTVTTTSANVYTYTHSAITETWPSYRVRAVNPGGNSAYSNEADPPPVLRVINNLDNRLSGTGNDWGKLNNIVRIRIGPTAASVEANGNTYERLAPYDNVYDITTANWISPSYTAANSYADFQLSTYSGIGVNYYLYLQCGWWEPLIPELGGGWTKRVTQVLCTNGTCCCYKWAYNQVTNHEAGYFIVKATDLGLVHGTWNGLLKGGEGSFILDAGRPALAGEQTVSNNK